MAVANEEIFNKVKDMIVDQLGADDDAVTAEASLIDDLEADSLDLIDLVQAIEDEFSLETISDDSVKAMKTVGDIVKYIEDNQ